MVAQSDQRPPFCDEIGFVFGVGQWPFSEKTLNLFRFDKRAR